MIMAGDEQRDWRVLGALAAIWTAAVAGGGLAAAAGPGFICALLLTCAVHGPTRAFVVSRIEGAWSRQTMLAATIVILAPLLMYVLPLELAFIMAGDVVMYLDALLAVSLITANMRLRAAATKLAVWVRARPLAVAARQMTARRRRRRPQQIRRPGRKRDPGDRLAPAYAPAFA